jgi:hypothetical protein
MFLVFSCSWSFGVWFSHVSFFGSCWLEGAQQEGGVLDFLDTWVAGGLGLGGLGLGVGLGLPQAPQSPCEFVSVGHVWTPISSSACSVCSFLFFFTSINIFCFQQTGLNSPGSEAFATGPVVFPARMGAIVSASRL